MPITVRNVQGMPVKLHLSDKVLTIMPGRQEELPIEKVTPEIAALIGKKVLRLVPSAKVAEAKPPARPAPRPAPAQAAKDSADKQSDKEE